MIAGEVAFYLLLNGLVSLAITVGLAALLARRLPPGGLRLAILATPLLKLAYLVGRGIPGDAFFWARMRGVRQELGSFLVGVGADRVGLRLDLSLQSHAAGLTWPSTVADGASAILGRRVSPVATVLVAELLVLVALVRLSLLVRRGLVRADEATLLEVRRLGPRTVRVLLDPNASVPHTGGVFRPWIRLPAALHATLAAEEREAVLAHELAHVRHLDVVLLGFCAAVHAVFWFVPGLGWLARAVRGECELRADAHAATEVDGRVLASALVRVAEGLSAERADAPSPALVERSLLAVRVGRLLAPPAAVSRTRRLGQLAFAALAIGLLLRTKTFGP